MSEPMKEQFTNPVTSALRDHAMSYPETSEGASCVNRAFKVKKKNFLFVGEKDDGSCKAMMKLGPSLDEAIELSNSDPRVEVGKFGWITVRFDAPNTPDAALLERWVDESYRQMAPKSLVKQL